MTGTCGILHASSQFLKASGFCSWHSLYKVLCYSKCPNVLGVVMGLPRRRISRHAKKNYSPSTWVRLKTELRGPLCGKLDIYPALVQHLLLSRILLIRNTVQNQERGKSPLGSKSPHNKDLALMLDAHDSPWLPTQSLLSFLPTIHSSSVVMGAGLTAH